MKKRVPTLEQFAKIVRTNKRRLERLYEDLGYARYLMYAAQGIDYSKPNVQHSTPQFDKITIDLDRIDRIEKKIAYYESFGVLWDEWQQKMTPRETDVFHKRYMQDRSFEDIAVRMGVSKQRVGALIEKLEKKWCEFITKKEKLLNEYRH